MLLKPVLYTEMITGKPKHLDTTIKQTEDLTVYLSMATVRCMMQWCSPGSVSNIQAAYMWYQSQSATCSPLCSCHV